MLPRYSHSLEPGIFDKLMKPICFPRLRLITSPDRRMGVEQIKKHPFFYGVDWNSIRNIEAPFIPRLRSITDTSYFPTDELDQVPDEPVGGDTTGAHKDLAFLGYVVPLTSFTLFCLDVQNADALGHAVIRSRGSRFLQTLFDRVQGQISFCLWSRRQNFPSNETKREIRRFHLRRFPNRFIL